MTGGIFLQTRIWLSLILGCGLSFIGHSPVHAVETCCSFCGVPGHDDDHCKEKDLLRKQEWDAFVPKPRVFPQQPKSNGMRINFSELIKATRFNSLIDQTFQATYQKMDQRGVKFDIDVKQILEDCFKEALSEYAEKLDEEEAVRRITQPGRPLSPSMQAFLEQQPRASSSSSSSSSAPSYQDEDESGAAFRPNTSIIGFLSQHVYPELGARSRFRAASKEQQLTPGTLEDAALLQPSTRTSSSNFSSNQSSLSSSSLGGPFYARPFADDSDSLPRNALDSLSSSSTLGRKYHGRPYADEVGSLPCNRLNSLSSSSLGGPLPYAADFDSLSRNPLDSLSSSSNFSSSQSSLSSSSSLGGPLPYREDGCSSPCNALASLSSSISSNFTATSSNSSSQSSLTAMADEEATIRPPT
ncbi:MAG: hypothetical protein RLZ12_489 [Bacillota bacterium]|jgi:hypothetical protein